MAVISATIGSIRAGATTFTVADLDARADIKTRRSHAATVTALTKDETTAAIATATDPVRHGDYKDGDNGYNRSYGTKDAYKNNYRSGFRQGYEAGYRDTRGLARR